ncbi:MAG: response regulator [Desulfobacula sp.]|nr:response regulator [Desulfobacula sp.]
MKLEHNSFKKSSKGHSINKDPFNKQALTLLEMKSILESSPAGIGIIKDRVLGWTNDVFSSMFGYEPDSLEEKNTRCLYADQKEYDRVGVELYSKLNKYGKGLIETTLVKKDGNCIDCLIRISRLNTEDPSKGCIFVISNISELKRLQVQAQQAQKMEAIGLLAGGVSHDFNNILMGIQGHLSLLQLNVDATQKVTTHAMHIGRLVETASELTKRLLGFARGGKYQISTLNINELFTSTLTIFKPTRKDIIIHERYEKNLLPVNADSSQIEQVFINLLANASQAMTGSGDIFVTTQNSMINEDHDYPFEVKPGRYTKLTIKDTGIGMDLETQKKIFDPFFSTKEIGNNKGRGLGLSTVYGIIKNHGGFILVDSEKTKGASFHIWLPASNNIPVKKIKKPRPFDQLQKGSETVLLVDDDEAVINIGKAFLEKLGYKPIIAKNGLEAIEIFRSYKYEISLVVLDLNMPETDGKQAFSEIKKIRENARILISTGQVIDDEIEGFLNQGCHGFIQKPFSLNTFAKTLRKIIDKT